MLTIKKVVIYLSDNFNILLGSKLDTSAKSIAEINKQIDFLSNQLTTIKLKINIDSDMFANLTNEFKALSSKLDLNMSTGKVASELDKITVQVKTMNDGTQKYTKNIQEVTKGLGQTQKITEVINHENEELSHTIVENTTNYKKQREEQEKLLSAWLKAKDAHMNAIHAEALRINKKYDDEIKRIKQVQDLREKSEYKYWEQRRKESVQNITSTPDGSKELNEYFRGLEKTSQSASVELAKLKDNATATTNVLKNFGKATHHEKADELTSSLKKLNITQDMTQKEMQETVARARELSNQLHNVSKEAKSTGNNSMTLGNMMSTAFEKFSV